MKYWRTPFDYLETGAARYYINVIAGRCKGCGLCVDYCPAHVLELSDQFNAKGYYPPWAARPEACVGCGFCEEVCPEFAIYCTCNGNEFETPESDAGSK